MKNKFDLIQNGYTVCDQKWGMQNESAIFYRVYYVYGGEAYLEHDGLKKQLEKGHLYVLPIMHPYHLSHNKEYPLDVLWFHVDMELSFYTEFGELVIEENSTLRHILEAIRNLTDKPDFFNELLQLFDVFLSILNEQLPLYPYRGKRMQKVIEYIDAHIDSELSVELLAEYIGMDRSYFSRKFKSIFNMSPNRYILSKKMNVAALELISGASVYQAAVAAGYKDEKAFSRAFKSHMEISPAKYRKSHILQP